MNSLWKDSCRSAALFALDPSALGGISLRACAGPVRDAWLAQLRKMLPDGAPVRRVPLNIADERLLGGLDLAATLRAGRPVAERGLLAETNGGVLLLAMAERLSAATAARMTAAIDAGEVLLERDGLGRRFPCRLGIVALDEGDGTEEMPPAALLERCAFLVDLGTIAVRDALAAPATAMADARALLPKVVAGEDAVVALSAVAMELGVASIRAVLMALHAARAAAALDGRAAVTEDDVTVAARLVLAPRATTIPRDKPKPPTELEEPPDPDVPEPEEASDDPGGNDSGAPSDASLNEIVLAAAKAAIPPGLLAALQASAHAPGRSLTAPGRAGAPKPSARRGRPVGVCRGELVAGGRLNIVATLRAAAPWQRLRRQASPEKAARIRIRSDDFRITRFQQRTESTVIFVVDASGSAALSRLAEAKGAVELLLADCYVRRDQVALLAFRGRAATLLLPPTGSLVRAKRSLAGLAGGGGTPLASALTEATSLGNLVRRRGQTAFIILLTDGRGNIALDGSPGRAKALMDGLAAARALRATGLAALLIDTSPSPQPQGRTLAAEMGARYLPLPYADAATLSRVVRAAL